MGGTIADSLDIQRADFFREVCTLLFVGVNGDGGEVEYSPTRMEAETQFGALNVYDPLTSVMVCGDFRVIQIIL